MRVMRENAHAPTRWQNQMRLRTDDAHDTRSAASEMSNAIPREAMAMNLIDARRCARCRFLLMLPRAPRLLKRLPARHSRAPAAASAGDASAKREPAGAAMPVEQQHAPLSRCLS